MQYETASGSDSNQTREAAASGFVRLVLPTTTTLACTRVAKTYAARPVTIDEIAGRERNLHLYGVGGVGGTFFFGGFSTCEADFQEARAATSSAKTFSMM